MKEAISIHTYPDGLISNDLAANTANGSVATELSKVETNNEKLRLRKMIVDEVPLLLAFNHSPFLQVKLRSIRRESLKLLYCFYCEVFGANKVFIEYLGVFEDRNTDLHRNFISAQLLVADHTSALLFIMNLFLA